MEPVLIGDIGGTNARFGILRDGEATEVRVLEVNEYPSLGDAARAYLAGIEGAPPKRGALAVAGPVAGDFLSFTNHPWSFSIKALTCEIGFDHLDVINDFAALAMAVPRLRTDWRRQIGPGSPVATAPIGVIGPGTGLGVSIVVPTGDGASTRWIPMAGEGGHVTLSPISDREFAVVRWVAKRSGKGHVSAETLLSGQGLATLYLALSALDGAASPALEPPEVTARALDGSDPIAVEAVQMFCALFGTVAGNLALTVGARGGVFIAGGIVPRLGAMFDGSDFRERFVAKGRMRAYLDPIPTYLITEKLPAFLGLAALLEQRA
jgi:glucokinase